MNSLREIVENDLSLRYLTAQFTAIEADKLSGHLIIQIESTPSWLFSFYLGKLSWINGGSDPLNRWQRNLENINSNCSFIEIGGNNKTTFNTHIVPQQSLVLEVLFDIIQNSQYPKNRLSHQMILIDTSNIKSNLNLPFLNIASILAQAIKSWQAWENAGLADYFPDRFPTIQDAAQLSQYTAIGNLSEILLSIDGNRSLRSLAIDHRQDLLDFTKSILPLLTSGAISFTLFPSKFKRRC